MKKEELDDWFVKVAPGRLIPRSISSFWVYTVKAFFQKIFRKSHTSDPELWNLYHHLARYLHRKLKAFQESDRMGFPASYETSEEWERDLQKMVNAFEFLAMQEEYSDNPEFFERVGLPNPEEEIEENRWESKLDFLKFEGDLFYNTEKEQALYDMAQEGLNIFSKSFLGLWD